MFHPEALKEDPSATKGRAECFHHSELERKTSSSTDDPKAVKELKQGWTDFLIIWGTCMSSYARQLLGLPHPKKSQEPEGSLGVTRAPYSPLLGWQLDTHHRSSMVPLTSDTPAGWSPLNTEQHCSTEDCMINPGNSLHLWNAQEPSKMQKEQANPEKTNFHFMKLHTSFMKLLGKARKVLYSEVQEGSNNAKRSKYTLTHTMK